MKTNPNDPINDVSVEMSGESGHQWKMINSGLTKRELFAAAALKGLCANPEIEGKNEEIAPCAVAMADALVKKLNANQGDNKEKTP